MFSVMNSFFVDQLIEILSVKRLDHDRFALKVICLVLFVCLFFGIFYCSLFFWFQNFCTCPTTTK